MAGTAAITALPKINHEHWCAPTGGRAEVRVEQFSAYQENEAGRAVPVVRVTRCLECGEARYDPIV